jgi:hypothetical protein
MRRCRVTLYEKTHSKTRKQCVCVKLSKRRFEESPPFENPYPPSVDPETRRHLSTIEKSYCIAFPLSKTRR